MESDKWHMQSLYFTTDVYYSCSILTKGNERRNENQPKNTVPSVRWFNDLESAAIFWRFKLFFTWDISEEKPFILYRSKVCISNDLEARVLQRECPLCSFNKWIVKRRSATFLVNLIPFFRWNKVANLSRMTWNKMISKSIA